MIQEEARAGISQHDYPPALQEIEHDTYDIVIVGAGPAGLMLASCLARYGGHRMLVVDSRSEPTTAGRADGIQPRTIEVLKTMEPLGSELISKSAASYERTFWYPLSTKDPKTGEPLRGITRTSRVQSFPTSMDIGDCNCTLGLQQGIIECGFLKDMDRHGQKVTRPWKFDSFELLEGSEDSEYPVQVQFEQMNAVVDSTAGNGAPSFTITGTGIKKTVRTKYLVGCDGGRSAVRKHMERTYEDVKFEGDWVDTLWAAMDCVVNTTFPDIRKIAAIHSAKHGALYIFPRENNSQGEPMVRAYTQVNRLKGEKSTENAFDAKDRVTAEMVQQAIKEIGYPYKWDFKSVEWFTVYPIGQRLVTHYTVPQDRMGAQEYLNHRIFLAGDACHTHSPKAGQGMNTAIIDSFSLAWRINLIQNGLGNRSALLQSYHDERRRTGKQLIDFDAEYSALFSGEIPKSKPELARFTSEQLKEHFVQVQRRNAAFTTGAGVSYEDNVLNFRDPSPLGLTGGPITTKLEPGMRLQPGWATRFVSSTPVRLVEEVQIDEPGGFRIYVLAGDLHQNQSHVQSFVSHLSSPQSFLNRFKQPTTKTRRRLPPVLNTGLDAQWSEEVNPFFAILTLIRANRFRFELQDVQEWGALRPRVYADDLEPGGDAWGEEDGDGSVGGVHRKWGLDTGGVVVCRPDGYVGAIFPIDEGQKGWDAMERYFDGFLVAS
ncbi:hypothetical protein A4X13_0g2865 [Tilletia indica]|uniref:FAD-binding domain-containing protein n=1 Tax=Tilletia indica TaxID=43049 RepID=A0A177TEN1_9BASI|nr:hypothetical protein A4X13_0g2865 [Tilletia indica]